MKKNWWLPFSILVFVLLFCLLNLIPQFIPISKESSYPFKSKITLGLDLQGGLYLILGIDFSKVYKEELRNFSRKVVSNLKDQDILVQTQEEEGEDPLDPRLTFSFASQELKNKAKEKIREWMSENLRLTKETETLLQYGPSISLKTSLEQQAVSKSIEVIRNRIDEFGVTEPEIMAQGTDRIVVQLPGVSDIERAKDLIGKVAKLEFRLVNSDISGTTLESWMKKVEESGLKPVSGRPFSEYVDKVNSFLRSDLPQGYELVFERISHKETGQILNFVPYLVENLAPISGEDLQDARVGMDQQRNMPNVELEFKPAAAKKFEDLTGNNINKRLAIILDGNVYSAPSISSKIGGGRATITLGQGSYSSLMKQASDVSLVLRAGALPVSLDFLEQRKIGPSLGQDSIRKASIAAVISVCLLFIFIAFYYRLSGVVAIVTLVLNVTLILASLAAFSATLTLPGIAGIALTVGMSVDGNIIIYERIREEIRKGLDSVKAIEVGFDNAFWTIIDANLTTAVAGLSLYNFGTGPIRGFAVTLLIGIVSTVYCSYFFNRFLLTSLVSRRPKKNLSI